MKIDYGYYVEKDDKYGFNLILLTLKHSDNPLKNIEAVIIPTVGFNLCKLTVGCEEVIKYDSERLNIRRSTGTPILYPTPNRVKECKFDFNGKTYKQVKNGIERVAHGLVYDEEWAYDLPIIQEDSISIKAWVDFAENSPIYAPFPFRHRLTVEYKLDITGMMLTYSVENFDVKELPFGFALHPFFEKLSGESGTKITIPTDYIMESTPDHFPTGKILHVENTCFDIRKSTSVGGLDIDHNYIGMKSSHPAKISYEDKPFDLFLNTSDEFVNLVLFTPVGKPHFCLENQTCSTDAHNLYNQGFKKESGLIIIAPGDTHTGYVKYSIHYKS